MGEWNVYISCTTGRTAVCGEYDGRAWAIRRFGKLETVQSLDEAQLRRRLAWADLSLFNCWIDMVVPLSRGVMIDVSRHSVVRSRGGGSRAISSQSDKTSIISNRTEDVAYKDAECTYPNKYPTRVSYRNPLLSKPFREYILSLFAPRLYRKHRLQSLFLALLDNWRPSSCAPCPPRRSTHSREIHGAQPLRNATHARAQALHARLRRERRAAIAVRRSSRSSLLIRARG